MSAEPLAVPPVTFESMNLSEPLRRALRDVGYVSPTAVQAATFGRIVEGKDVIVQSKTGSGKTAAFAIPLLDRVVTSERAVQVLVLCPTRELALQVAGEFERLGKYRGVKTAAIYGGASMVRQIEDLESGAQVVSGTPGRVLDHLRRGTLDVSRLKAIVLDEADEMLSMGFAEELNAILEFIPKKRQGLLFSATIPDQVQQMARRHLHEPEFFGLSTDQISPTEIDHLAYFVTAANRARELVRIMEIEKPDGAMIFCNTKDETVIVANELQRLGLAADWLNSDRPQSERERVMGAFRAGQLKYLVATDVAARGIDVSNVSHVINFGFPEVPEQYVHRTGRTGRAGRRGTAISLIGPHDVGKLYFLRLTYGIRPIERSLPSAGEERTKREIDRLNLLREAFTTEPSDEALSLARRVIAHDDGERIVASLVSEFFNVATKQAIAEGLGAARSLGLALKPEEAPAATTPASISAEVAKAPLPSREGREGRETRARGTPTGQAARVRAAERPRRIDVPGEGPLDEEGPEPGMEEMRLAIGRRDGIRAGDLAREIRERAKLERRDLGRIFVRDRFTLVNVRASKLEATLAALRDVSINDRPLSPERGKSVAPSIPPPARASGEEEGTTPAASADVDAQASTMVPSIGEREGEPS